MSEVRRSVRCTRCGEEYDFDQVRFLPNGNDLACFVCLGLEQKQEEEQERKEGRIFDYQCIDCRFKFSRNATNLPKVCPDCSNHNFVRYEKGTLDANRVIKMADDPRLDRMDRPGEFG
ncbi:hypothetical protein GOV11_02235 [Candidatus Woesearchaeota archaeon]|nr:hypothetical protein [Candidatus Woesearchaeota archaeon]